jgi:hypothetical protein
MDKQTNWFFNIVSSYSIYPLKSHRRQRYFRSVSDQFPLQALSLARSQKIPFPAGIINSGYRMMRRPDFDPDEICNQISDGVIKSVVAGILHWQINRISNTFPCIYENGDNEDDHGYDRTSGILLLIIVRKSKETERDEKKCWCGDDNGLSCRNKERKARRTG